MYVNRDEAVINWFTEVADANLLVSDVILKKNQQNLQKLQNMNNLLLILADWINLKIDVLSQNLSVDSEEIDCTF